MASGMYRFHGLNTIVDKEYVKNSKDWMDKLNL